MSYNNNSNNNNNSSNELRPSLGNWRTIHHHHFETGQRPPPTFPNSPPRSSHNTQLWGALGYSLSRFPTQSVHSPMRLLVLNSGIPREPIPGRRSTIRGTPPAYFGQHSFSIPTYQEQTESRPSPDRQSNNALKMLKKEIYNSPPKSITRRLSSFYRERDQGKPLTERTIEKNDDEHGKRCAVCLEDFEPKQEVMVTPCKHMFHEDCIVPWMKSNDQCPVCRFTMGEPQRPRQRTTMMMPVRNNSVVEDMAANNLFAGELMSVIQAMEEAFQWGTVVRNL